MPLKTKTIQVLLFDDHQTMLWGLTQLIDGQRPMMEVVDTATTCAQAVAKARTLKPDIILLDLEVGGQSAVDVLPAMLSNSVSRALVLTGERRQKMLDRAILNGARGVLQKNAGADQVLTAINRIHGGEIWLDRVTVGRVFSALNGPSERSKRKADDDIYGRLTAREREVLGCIAGKSGASNKVLANHLFISEHTLRNHLTSIYQKLGVATRLELYVYVTTHRFPAARKSTRGRVDDQAATDAYH